MADVYREVNCSICNEKNIRWNSFVCLVCPKYYLCRKCHEENHYSKPHRPYHPMQPVLGQQDFFKNVNSIIPAKNDIRFCCPYCAIWMPNVAELLHHCKLKHDRDSDCVRCPVCVTFCIPQPGLQFQQFMDHLKQYHRERGLYLTCDTCKTVPIVGSYHSCLICNDYDLCENCFKARKHNLTHMPYHPMQLVLGTKVEAEQNSPPCTMYRCPFCGENEFSAGGLADHCQELHMESQTVRVRCPICSVCRRLPFNGFCLLKDSLLDHLKNYHGILPKDQKPEPEVDLCSICLSQVTTEPVRNYFQCVHNNFHGGCIQAWLDINATCPECRAERVN